MLIRRHFGRRTLVALLLVVTLLLSSCTTKSTGSGSVLSQKPPTPTKTSISVLVKYAFPINSFEQAVENKFPNIDIVQVGNFTKNMGIEEYAARLEHDDLTDIVMTWPLDVGKEYWDDRLLDLSGMDFTGRYNVSMLNTIATDGKLYYLPGPAQIRGIVYNKTLFAENNWKVPDNYDGFIDLCKTIEKSGIRSLQLGFADSEVLDTAFIGYNYGDCFGKPQDMKWLQQFNKGTGRFDQQFGTALDQFQEMIDAGIWQKGDLDINYSTRESMLFTRQCAMVEDSCLLPQLAFEQAGTTDEYAMMPFFNKGENNDWARLYMVCYIGLNKHLAEPENKEKMALVMEIMDYISSVEGQNALTADTGAMYSSLIGAPSPENPEIEKLINALDHGRSAIFPTLKNAQQALREGLAGMLAGTHTKKDVALMVDTQNLTPTTSASSEVLSKATEDFSEIDTGSFVADAFRSWGNSDIALFLDNGKDGRYNGKGLSGRIYGGDITVADINRIMPDLKSGDNGNLWKGSISGENLIKTLEHSISVANNQTGWFYYFSGLKMKFNPTAQPGSRIKEIKFADGQPIDPARNYTIVVPEGSVPEEYLQGCDKTNVSSYKLITDTVKSAELITPSKDNRFVITNK